MTGQNAALATAKQVMARTGVTFRRLDYWARTGVIVPHGAGQGPGRRRGWNPEQVREVEIMTVLSDAGINPVPLTGLVHAAAAGRREFRFGRGVCLRVEHRPGRWVGLGWPDGCDVR